MSVWGKQPPRLITYNGQTLSCADWSRRLGGAPALVSLRLKRGWTEQEAVSVPLGDKRPPGSASEGQPARKGMRTMTKPDESKYIEWGKRYEAMKARVQSGERSEQLQRELDEAGLELGLGHNSYLSLVRVLDEGELC